MGVLLIIGKDNLPLLYRKVSASYWSNDIGGFNPSLAKGPVSTTWIWNLHSSPHDFFIGESDYSMSNANISRKVMSSGLAHLSVISFWISGMLFHAAYFSNYVSWVRDPGHVKPSAHVVWSLVGQDSINYDVGGYFQGIYITSGLFHIWRSHGIVTLVHLKCASLASFIASCTSLYLSYYLMHVVPLGPLPVIMSYRNIISILGLACISWSGHLIHIAIPINSLIDSGVDPTMLQSPQALLSYDVLKSIFPSFGASGNLLLPLSDSSSSLVDLLCTSYSSASSLSLPIIASHHLYLGCSLVLSNLLLSPRP